MAGIIRKLKPITWLGLLLALDGGLDSAARGQIAFVPDVAPLFNGTTMTVTPAVSADRRYVRLGVNAYFNTINGFTTYSSPLAAVGGGGGTGFGGFGGLAGMNGPIGAGGSGPGPGTGVAVGGMGPGVVVGQGGVGFAGSGLGSRFGSGGLVGGPPWPDGDGMGGRVAVPGAGFGPMGFGLPSGPAGAPAIDLMNGPWPWDPPMLSGQDGSEPVRVRAARPARRRRPAARKPARRVDNASPAAQQPGARAKASPKR